MSPSWFGMSTVRCMCGGSTEQVCAVCHGESGISVVPNVPNLAGQPEIYLAEQLTAIAAASDPTQS